MSYKLIGKDTGERMSLLHREWEMLLLLAYRYDWTPERGDIDHYAQRGIVSQTDAAAMAAAINRALPDVPSSLADGFTEADRPKPRTLAELRRRPGDDEGDPLAYFSGHRRNNTLRHFTSKIASGPFEIVLSPGFSEQV